MEEVEKELCGNCKKEIPQNNYVMHTAFCTRNISLCGVCQEPFPKSQIEQHKKKCEAEEKKKSQSLSSSLSKISIGSSKLEDSSYYKEKKAVEDKKVAQRQANRLQRIERLVDAGDTVGHYRSKTDKYEKTQFQQNGYEKQSIKPDINQNVNHVMQNKVEFAHKNLKSDLGAIQKNTRVETSLSSKSTLMPCKYCDLELPKLDLEDHESYCGARTDKCLECGELVMFKYKDLHQETNHGFLKLNDEPGPRPSWESTTNASRTSVPDSPTRKNRSSSSLFRNFSGIENFIPPSYGITSSYSTSSLASNKSEKLESSKEISRRLDCKTEYIRNLLHDSASITAPIRSTGAVPRNHYNHNKGPAPQPPRRRNPPTELLIPCEFCDVPIPHEDLIQHETGCRPDLARFNVRRRRSPSPPYRQDDEEELPCEFCSNLIPASQLWRHQETCN